MSTLRGLTCAMLILAPALQAEVPHLINFQGVLQMGGTELTGAFEITFRLYDASSGGSSLWSETDSVHAINGYYAVVLGKTTALDLEFNQDLWLALEITGQPEMAPRFQLTSSPYALAIADDVVDSSKIRDGSILLFDVAQSGASPGQVPKWDGTRWIASDDDTGTQAATPWSRSGSDVSLVDITDRVGIGTHTPAEKLDVEGNLRVSGKATIGSGNTNTGLSSFVAGANNSSTGNFSTIAGGEHNFAGSDGATVSGGRRDSAIGILSSIGGGTLNLATGDGTTVAGGRSNTAQNLYSTVGGGHTNVAGADYATVSGGNYNSATADFSWVGGGAMDSATGSYASVGGGISNHAAGEYSSIGGGALNRATGNRSTISGGSTNKAAGRDAVIGGGFLNSASDERGTVSGGGMNAAVGDYATVGGGFSDSARGLGTTVAGGYRNIADKEYATVSGGSGNKADSNYATVGGGLSNVARGYAATVGGGVHDSASGDFSTVAGGRNNTASGDYSVVSGWGSTAAGDNSFAAGLQAKALHDGAFVWADKNPVDYSSTAVNEFSIRASGGIRIHSNLALTAGITMSPGASSWSAVSDRNLKENIREIDGKEILDRIARLPISRWNYIAQDESIEHVGPMAQDFYGLFGLGEDARHIDMLDPAGIALAAIKELYRQNQNLKAQNMALSERLVAVESKLR